MNLHYLKLKFRLLNPFVLPRAQAIDKSTEVISSINSVQLNAPITLITHHQRTIHLFPYPVSNQWEWLCRCNALGNWKVLYKGKMF